MKRPLSLLFGLAALVAAAPAPADAFCGFFVSKADTKIFNKASKVVIARDGDRTVMTMSNDFKGEPKEFAVVVPVPTFLQKDQIHVGEQSLIDHLDAFTAPRLVEYFDENPCDRRRYSMMERAMPMAASPAGAGCRQDSAKRLGVTIEATYTVGEYDILILSAKESGGLATWLTQNGYKMPQGAAPVLASYLAQNMRFFVAKVNLGEQAKLGFNYLRPLQIAYESPKFMLPIRLGTLNAEGTQELFVFTLTNKGRVETTNYRTVRLPSDVEIPTYVKGDFGRFYKSMFSTQVKKQNMSTVFLEYAWDMGWCDPCAADPLSNDQLRKLGVFWLDGGATPAPTGGVMRPRPMPRPMPRGGEQRLRDAPARPLRRRPLPRGSGLPGDRRPLQLPGPLRPAPRLDGHRDVLGSRRLPPRAEHPPREGSPDPGEPDRLGHQRDPAQTGPGAARRRRRPRLVAASLAVGGAR